MGLTLPQGGEKAGEQTKSAKGRKEETEEFETHSIRTVTEEMHLVAREEPHDSLMGEEVRELEGVTVQSRKEEDASVRVG